MRAIHQLFSRIPNLKFLIFHKFPAPNFHDIFNQSEPVFWHNKTSDFEIENSWKHVVNSEHLDVYHFLS